MRPRHGGESGGRACAHPYRLAVGPEPEAATLIEIPIQRALDEGEQYAWLPDFWEGVDG